LALLNSLCFRQHFESRWRLLERQWTNNFWLNLKPLTTAMDLTSTAACAAHTIKFKTAKNKINSLFKYQALKF